MGFLSLKLLLGFLSLELILGSYIWSFVGTHLENKATVISGWGISESGFKSATATEAQVRKFFFGRYKFEFH